MILHNIFYHLKITLTLDFVLNYLKGVSIVLYKIIVQYIERLEAALSSNNLRFKKLATHELFDHIQILSTGINLRVPAPMQRRSD